MKGRSGLMMSNSIKKNEYKILYKYIQFLFKKKKKNLLAIVGMFFLYYGTCLVIPLPTVDQER
jgi:hypothetical protein